MKNKLYNPYLLSRPLGAIIITTGLVAPHVLADDFEWNTTTGDFPTAANWTNVSGVDLGPPDTGDIAIVKNAGTATWGLSGPQGAAIQVGAGGIGSVVFDTNAGTFTSSSNTWACTITSSAVVGSSAINRSGSHASARAMSTRWR